MFLWSCGMCQGIGPTKQHGRRSCMEPWEQSMCTTLGTLGRRRIWINGETLFCCVLADLGEQAQMVWAEHGLQGQSMYDHGTQKVAGRQAE
mmetsp:Transcript_41128/g.129185  ORF Transcript_41128/g.129185 Transcript_41128/m.129185 type:complete len:91 (-) Transcript_41128:592-864(-)